MQAIKALYKEGKIQLLSPLQGVTEAELFIIVLDKSEQDFNAIGQANFFDTDEDNNVDWEAIFDVKPR